MKENLIMSHTKKPDFNPFVLVRNLGTYTDQFHTDLRRCDSCRMKYDSSELIRISGYRMICRFCVNVKGVNDV